VQHTPQIHVETSKNLLAAVDQSRLNAEAMEDIGELDGNVTTAGDDNGSGQFS
jgi:hypothetical protein